MLPPEEVHFHGEIVQIESSDNQVPHKPNRNLLEGLRHTVGLDVGIPVLLPAVALPTQVALERLQAHVLVHVLLEIFSFVEPLLTAAGDNIHEAVIGIPTPAIENLRMNRHSLSTTEGTDVRLGLVLLQVFAQSRGLMKRRSARVAQVLRFACERRPW